MARCDRSGALPPAWAARRERGSAERLRSGLGGTIGRAPHTTSAPPGESIPTDAALPRLPLARFLPGAAGRPDRLTEWQVRSDGTADSAPEVDHGIALGGIASDLFSAAAPDEYWMVTDRGPNGRVEADGKNRGLPVVSAEMYGALLGIAPVHAWPRSRRSR